MGGQTITQAHANLIRTEEWLMKEGTEERLEAGNRKSRNAQNKGRHSVV
jgi:hypothetical protein